MSKFILRMEGDMNVSMMCALDKLVESHGYIRAGGGGGPGKELHSYYIPAPVPILSSAVCKCEQGSTAPTCTGFVQMASIAADCCECEMPDGTQCCHAEACHVGGAK